MPGMDLKKTHYQKRKTPFKNPFTCIQTRNRTLSFVNRTRSGRSRADPVARNLILSEPKSIALEHLSRIPRVKDLRTKRIFTPDADSSPIEKEERKDNSKSLDSVELLGLEASSDSDFDLDKSQKLDLEEKEKNVDSFVPAVVNKESTDIVSDQISENEKISGNGMNSVTKTVVNLCKRRKVFSSPSSFSYKRMLPYLMETQNDDSSGFKLKIHGVALSSKMQKPAALNREAHSISKNVLNSEFDQQILSKVTCNEHEIGQTTPLNTDMFSKIDVGCGGETPETNNELTMNQIHDGLSVGNEMCRRDSWNESKCSTNLMVLKPCSRLRVFKNPKSVSYKRLLPFLMNMSKENTSVSRTNQCQTPLLDSQNGTHPLSSSTAEQTNVNETIAENCEKKHLNDRGSDSNPNSPYPVQCANKSSNIELSSLTFKSPPPLDNSSLPELEIPQIEISNLKELPIRSVSVEQLTQEEVVSATKRNECIDVVEICNKNEEIKFDKSALNPEVSCATVTPKDNPLKGILKRNPRGCRGPCNCLNCASFRLHADRAYEFSRNQLHDAEEIASDLMNELAVLRLMLEKADVHENNLDIVQLSTVQIKEACKRVLETENLAKARLDELTYDLNVHCRLPGLFPPQVMFASNVQANLRLNRDK